MQDINDTGEKWWVILAEGDPSKLFEDHPEIKKTSIPFATCYTGFKGYYEVYCYGTKWGMKKLFHSMQGHLSGRDLKLIGEEEISQDKILEDDGLKLLFAPLLLKLGLLNI